MSMVTQDRPREQEEPSPADYLGSLLAELRQTNWPATTEDPEAAWTCLNEGERALRQLRRVLPSPAEVRSYLDPLECGALLCICGNPDGDPCPLCAMNARLDKAVMG